MILSDRQIREALANGRIVITPPPEPAQFAPSAVDLRLGKEFKTWKAPEPDHEPIRLRDAKIPDFGTLAKDLPVEEDGSAIIRPGRFLLTRTLERVALPVDSRLAARVEGRSSYARLGLVVHMTAPTIHAGFEGSIVLEMMNFGPFPLRLDPGQQICQLIFEELGSDPSSVLKTDFQGQSNVLGGD